MQQRTYTHIHTHTQRPESTSPCNSVDTVLCLPFPYAELGSTGSRKIDVTLVPSALQEHTDTQEPKMHLIALRGAEITLARKSKEQVRWTYPAEGGRQGSERSFLRREFLSVRAETSWCAHLENPPLSLFFPSSSGRKRGGSTKEMKPKLTGLEWKEKEEATKIRLKSQVASLHWW